jgi:putative membrane protein
VAVTVTPHRVRRRAARAELRLVEVERFHLDLGRGSGTRQAVDGVPGQQRVGRGGRLESGPGTRDGAPREVVAMRFLLHWLLSALSLMIVAHVVPGFHVAGFGTALLAAVAIRLVNATIGLVLRLLALPLTVLTFGLFWFVVNAILLWTAAALVPGFAVAGFGAALLGSIALTLVNAALRYLVAA